MVLKLVPKGGETDNSGPSRRELLIGTAAGVGGASIEAIFGPVKRLYRLLADRGNDTDQDDFPDGKVLDELEARRNNISKSRHPKTEDESAIIDDTSERALSAGTTDPQMPTISEEPFEARMQRLAKEADARKEAIINGYIQPAKIAELERKLDAVPKYLQDLQLKFKPDGKLETADEAKIRAFLVETLGCKPAELKFQQYENSDGDGTEKFDKMVYIELHAALVANIDAGYSNGTQFHFTGTELGKELRDLRIIINPEGVIEDYEHLTVKDDKPSRYRYDREYGRKQLTLMSSGVDGDTNRVLEETSVDYDAKGPKGARHRKDGAAGETLEVYYRDRATYDEVQKKSQ